MTTLAVQCQNNSCSGCFALPKEVGGGAQTFDDQTKALSALLGIERREIWVGLHNSLLDLPSDDLAVTREGIPQELLARSIPATCPHCNRTYLYSSRDAFLTLESPLPTGCA